MATKKRKSTVRRAASRKKQAQQRLPAGLGTLFAGLLLIVLAFVQGDSVWRALHDVLFGLFGCGSFVLGAAVCCLAVQYTRGEDLLPKIFKLVLGLIFASGTVIVFSGIQPQGLSAFQMVAACYENGVSAWLGGGALGAVLGGSLKRRERISARLGDILSQLYLASAVLKRYDDEGRNEADLPLVHWGVQDALYQAEQAMDDLLQNFPNRVVAGLLNVVIFPTGRHYLAPSDKLDHKVAKILQVPNATRSRIGRGQYLTPSEHNPVGLLEEALVDVIAADPIHQRICKELGKNLPFTRLDELAHNALAKGLIDKDEAAILVKAEESRLRSINVDDFDPEELATKPVKLPEKVRKVEAA